MTTTERFFRDALLNGMKLEHAGYRGFVLSVKVVGCVLLVKLICDGTDNGTRVFQVVNN